MRIAESFSFTFEGGGYKIFLEYVFTSAHDRLEAISKIASNARLEAGTERKAPEISQKPRFLAYDLLKIKWKFDFETSFRNMIICPKTSFALLAVSVSGKAADCPGSLAPAFRPAGLIHATYCGAAEAVTSAEEAVATPS